MCNWDLDKTGTGDLQEYLCEINFDSYSSSLTLSLTLHGVSSISFNNDATLDKNLIYDIKCS
jgi:hypothetical protein